MSNYDGILIMDKEKGITSHTLLTKVKKILNVSKIGHAGTLDPLATGVMVVLLGNATKLSDYMMCDNKEYICEILIGMSSDTLDITGNILEEKLVQKDLFSSSVIDEVLESFVGANEQVPPMYSSVHHEGKKLYLLAREGKTVERSARSVVINSIKRISELDYSDNYLKFSFITNVSKGTYIRSLCLEIGKRIGYPALMSNLRRTKSGEFDITSSYTLDDLLSNKFTVINKIDAIKSKNTFVLNKYLYSRVKNGMKIRLDIDTDEVFLIYQDTLCAIYEKDVNSTVQYGYKAKRIWN